MIPPAVDLLQIDDERLQRFREQHALQPEEPVIGMLARLATEKGVEYLVQAMPLIQAQFPRARAVCRTVPGCFG